MYSIVGGNIDDAKVGVKEGGIVGSEVEVDESDVNYRWFRRGFEEGSIKKPHVQYFPSRICD